MVIVDAVAACTQQQLSSAGPSQRLGADGAADSGAVAAGGLAAALDPHWDVGDLLVVVYFAAVSLALWGQSARIGLARSTAPFTPIVAVAFGAAFAIGLVLVIVDLATRGSL